MVYCILAGILIGAIGTYIFLKIRTDGDLVIYLTGYPDEPPYLGCDLNKQVTEISKKRSVHFKVVIKHLNSQN